LQEAKVFHDGDLICEQGKVGTEMYFIKHGKVAVFLNGSHIDELGPGEIFGEMALIDDKPRSADVITISPCKAVFMGKNKFNGFIHDRSEMALRWMGFICLSLFSRILRLDRVYTDMKRRLGEAFDF
jgi:CRP-like cAMP-binding protein